MQHVSSYKGAAAWYVLCLLGMQLSTFFLQECSQCSMCHPTIEKLLQPVFSCRGVHCTVYSSQSSIFLPPEVKPLQPLSSCRDVDIVTCVFLQRQALAFCRGRNSVVVQGCSWCIPSLSTRMERCSLSLSQRCSDCSRFISASMQPMQPVSFSAVVQLAQPQSF